VSPHRRRWDVLARVTFGRVRQLDRVVAESLRRAWAAGAGPGDQRLVLRRRQLRLHGYAEQGTGFGYTNQRGYHPILAIRAGTGEVLHVRLRTGSANTLRGIGRFCDELIARVGRAGASGPKLLRANPGFWNKQTFTKLDRRAGNSRSACACNRTGAPRSSRRDHHLEPPEARFALATAPPAVPGQAARAAGNGCDLAGTRAPLGRGRASPAAIR
jgi:hypothetical protein